MEQSVNIDTMADIPAGVAPITFLQEQTVPVLKRYLQQRGVTVGTRRKGELVDLCLRAHTLGLSRERTEDDEGRHSELARTVAGSVLPHPASLETPWDANMRPLPMVSILDAFGYLSEKCGWDMARLKRFKDDRGYLLHQSGHVSNVKQNRHGSFSYVRGQCTPQTRLSAKPYDLWLLISEEGQIITGQCTCTA